jgi:integrase
VALTDTEIRKSKPRAKPYKLSDGGGLFLWVTPAGGKFWRWKYRFEGKEKLMALGKYPDVPLVEVRRRHLEARRTLAAGIDPMAQRKEEKAAKQTAFSNSFQVIAAEWLEHWRHDKTPRHAGYVERRIDTDINPALGPRSITEIKASELVAMVKAIERRGVRDLAKRALETTGQIFRFAIANGYADHNPAAEIKPGDLLKSSKKVNLARIDAKELPQLLRSIEGYHGANVTRLAMKLLAMTFVRTSELIGARWEEIDGEAARWNIPGSRMKMKTPHIVPLASQAIELLDSLRCLTGNSEWLFPGEGRRTPTMSNNTILLALARMGYRGKMTGHGFRGLASTILHEQGYVHEHIELQLAHAPRNAVSAAYNHALHLESRAQMMQDWANFLEDTQRKGKVLPLRKGVA